MKTLADCEKFIDKVGMATVLPGKSPFTCLLWEAQGHQGSFSGDDPAFQNIWNWKDELPGKKLAFAGRLLSANQFSGNLRIGQVKSVGIDSQEYLGTPESFIAALTCFHNFLEKISLAVCQSDDVFLFDDRPPSYQG